MRRPVFLVAVAIVALLAASGIAVAVTSSNSGGAIETVRVATSTDKFTRTLGIYGDIPGATSGPIWVGDGSLLLARYSAESRCFSGEQICSVRIVAVRERDGKIWEMQPASGADFAFHNGSSGLSGVESHSMDRSLQVSIPNPIIAEYYSVKAQAAAYGGSSFTLDDWSLTVEEAD